MAVYTIEVFGTGNDDKVVKGISLHT